jgi:hypothetical protein
VPPFCLFMYVAGRGGQQFFTCCPAGYIAFIWSHVTTIQPIMFGVHPCYITNTFIQRGWAKYCDLSVARRSIIWRGDWLFVAVIRFNKSVQSLLAKIPNRLLKTQQSEPCLLLCSFEFLFKNLKCTCVSRYFETKNWFQKCACSHIICTSYLQLTYNVLFSPGCREN